MVSFSRFPPVFSQVPDARRRASRLERCLRARETISGKEGCFSVVLDSAAVPGLTSSTGFSAVCEMQAVGQGHTAATVLSSYPVRVCEVDASAAHGWEPVVLADGAESVGKPSHGHSAVRGGKGRLAVLPRADSKEQRAGGRFAGHPDHGTPDGASEVAGDIDGCVFSRVAIRAIPSKGRLPLLPRTCLKEQRAGGRFAGHPVHGPPDRASEVAGDLVGCVFSRRVFSRATPSKAGLLCAPSHSRVERSVIDTSCSRSQTLDPSAHARTCTVPDPSGVAVAAALALCASASSSGVASSVPRSFAAVAAALSSALAARAAEVSLHGSFQCGSQGPRRRLCTKEGVPDRPKIRTLIPKGHRLIFGRLVECGGRLWVLVHGGDPGHSQWLATHRGR